MREETRLLWGSHWGVTDKGVEKTGRRGRKMTLWKGSLVTRKKLSARLVKGRRQQANSAQGGGERTYRGGY